MKRHKITKIKTDDDYMQALARLDELVHTREGIEGAEYNQLFDLIEEFEQQELEDD